MKMRNWVWDGGPKINFLVPQNKKGDNGQGLKILLHKSPQSTRDCTSQ